MIKNSILSGYEMVGKLFNYITYVVVKLEKMWIKDCNLLKIGYLSTYIFLCLSKQNGFCFRLSFTSGSNIQEQAKIKKIAS